MAKKACCKGDGAGEKKGKAAKPAKKKSEK